jgi:anion-transporting  ArsA/GET3 family ATPase
MDLRRVIAESKLVVCVGPGGVGKTTVSAALGLAAARAGRRACVLTVDPAKRLASALGVSLGDEPSRVRVDAPGELWAAMLDAPASFAAMVERLCPEPSTRARLLEHPMYRAGAGALSQSHAYAAMEWLHDVFDREAFDLVVLDTPPAAVGVEMFDAPGRLLQLLEPKAFAWLLASPQPTLVGRVIAGGGALVRRAAESLVGDGVWSSLVDFLTLLARLQPAFVERAAAMNERLRRTDTRFVMVSRPEALAAADVEQIARALHERSLQIAAAVWNRVPAEVQDPGPLDVDAVVRRLGLGDGDAACALAAARQARRDAAAEHDRARHCAQGVMTRLQISDAVTVPELASMGALADLERIADAMLAVA